MSDANWAGCKATRKSTSGGCVLLGKHRVNKWSKTQHCISTSLAESEGVAMIKAVSEGMGIARVLEDFDKEGKCVEVLADAKAALGIIEREGVGKGRHMDVGIFWLQQKWLHNVITVAKVLGTHNTADLMTKPLSHWSS